MSNGNNASWFLFFSWNFWCVTRGEFWLKYCLLPSKNLSVPLPPLPSEVPPWWCISLVYYLNYCTFSFSPFPQHPDLEVTFLRGSSHQQLTPWLSHVFFFSWSHSHLSSCSTSSFSSGLVEHSHQASLTHPTFAVMTLPQDLRWHKYMERIWAASPITSWHHIHDLT